MNLIDRIEAAGQAAAELERLIPVKVEEVLKLHHNRVVFRVDSEQGPAVAKRLLGPKAAAQITAMQAELDYIAPHMTGTFRVARCLKALPEAGVILLERAPGQPLTRALAGPDRATLIAQAREWLAAYTAPRREIVGFAPDFWLKQVKLRVQTTNTGGLDFGATIIKLGELARHRGARMAKASTHGDFVAANLLTAKNSLWGVDIEGECRLPLAKEAARFLIWARMSDNLPSSAKDYRAFAPEILLEPGEDETTLPFFTGFEIVMRMLDVAKRPHHLPPLRAMLVEWLG